MIRALSCWRAFAKGRTGKRNCFITEKIFIESQVTDTKIERLFNWYLMLNALLRIVLSLKISAKHKFNIVAPLSTESRMDKI